MARRTIGYTTSASKTVSYVWKCSKCGKVNRGVTQVTSEVFTPAGTSSSRVRDELDAAKASVAKNVDAKARKLLEGPVSRQGYKALRLNGRCQACNHKESWHNPDDSVGAKLLRALPLVLGAALLVVLILLVSDKNRTADSDWLIWIILAMLVILPFTYGLRYLLVHSKEKNVEDKPLSSFPVMTRNNVPVVNANLYVEGKTGEAESR